MNMSSVPAPCPDTYIRKYAVSITLCHTLVINYARLVVFFLFFFLREVENKSSPACSANEVGKDPIIQFEDKLPEHSEQD